MRKIIIKHVPGFNRKKISHCNSSMDSIKVMFNIIIERRREREREKMMMMMMMMIRDSIFKFPSVLFHCKIKIPWYVTLFQHMPNLNYFF